MDEKTQLETLEKLQILKETNPEAYAEGLRELTASLEAYNNKVAEIIKKLEA